MIPVSIVPIVSIVSIVISKPAITWRGWWWWRYWHPIAMLKRSATITLIIILPVSHHRVSRWWVHLWIAVYGLIHHLCNIRAWTSIRFLWSFLRFFAIFRLVSRWLGLVGRLLVRLLLRGLVSRRLGLVSRRLGLVGRLVGRRLGLIRRRLRLVCRRLVARGLGLIRRRLRLVCRRLGLIRRWTRWLFNDLYTLDGTSTLVTKLVTNFLRATTYHNDLYLVFFHIKHLVSYFCIVTKTNIYIYIFKTEYY
ncbi:hypothetical protein HanXRQr2_Chr16g0753641 [Helianthus annuus]|uniref:Uncharacterized protein n=1 Tax=Helianthus annuus TaxID=4232 RepID=A0A9K3GYH3_HELAN|nr:hypothetical protein HanXRQr2_Chr16g0753641 [Helianthus annuus]KAJ0443264.1 hypothetical protein HanIR_Chr16g0818851 [Helianthus annuus]KAJ0821616.1 hypothetical protein HanPSC8_Chr16g0722351 [Helianthus annuus]